MGLVGRAALGAEPAAAPRRRVLRVAHFTDSHIQPERGAFDGVTACLRHMMALKPRPDLVITGGDLIMDSFEAEEPRTRLQWELFTKVFRDECGLPVSHCLGNHDIWGWDQRKSKTTSNERRWGKRWAMDTLGLESSYYAIDRAGWRIIVLDSVAPRFGDHYTANLGEEQRCWLDERLEEAGPKTPVLIVSHIPIYSMCAVDHDGEIKEGDWSVVGAVMHTDAQAVMSTFRRRANVRLCLSGHIHMLDRIDFHGVTFICDGAVSGAWWKGPKERCTEGYGVIDLFDDGTFEHRYETYGWQAREEPTPS